MLRASGGRLVGRDGELTRLLGRASPFAIIVGALGVAIIMYAPRTH